MKNILWICLCLTAPLLTAAQTRTDSNIAIVRKVADYIITHASFKFTGIDNKQVYDRITDVPADVKVKLADKAAGWHYPNGVLNIALLDLGQLLGDDRYTQYAMHQLRFAFDHAAYFEALHKKGISYPGFPFRPLWITRILDDCGSMGASLLEVYKKEKRDDYRAYINRAAKHIHELQERLPDGTLCRPNPYKWTIWGDDLYMSVPFLARMGALTGEKKYWDDAIAQVKHFTHYLWNPGTGLYTHYYYQDLQRQGVAHWGRANGWIMLAKVHLLNHLPAGYPGRDSVLADFTQQMLGVARYQGPDGLWHQVLDRTDSYTETSCTAMFVYAIARAVNEGWVDKRYMSIAQRGWEGLVKEKIMADGQLKDVCIGTNTSADMAFYYNRPTEINDFHGTGPVIEAGIEIIRYARSNGGK